jgi:peroxiredoxin
MVAAGDRIPDVTVRMLTDDGVKEVKTADVLGKGKVVLFAVPGAFTPTCSDYHLPGFVVRAGDLKAKGVETIACVSVNDAWVMGAWGAAQNVGDNVLMLADGSGDFTKAMGLENDMGARGLGLRSKRYAAVLEDGVIKALNVEEAGKFEVSSADAVLAAV